jgi:hypothetical protein
MSPRSLALLCSSLLLAACASTSGENVGPPKELDAYTKTGRTETCLGLASIGETRVLDDEHILFIMRGGNPTYLNKLPRRCNQLGFNRSFSYSTSLTKLCSTDIITVLDTADASPLSSCGLGVFEELEKKAE